jgi:hypothetical protein
MRKALRWLAVVVWVDTVVTAVFLAFLEGYIHAATYLSALWNSGFGTFRAGIEYEMRAANFTSPQEMAVGIALTIGLVFGICMARESWRQPGWRFWRWQGPRRLGDGPAVGPPLNW